RESIDLVKVVRSAVQECQLLVDSRGHQLTVELPSSPVPLHADPTRLEQVLTNLLSNAAKYTDPGGRIWLNVEREPTEAVVRVRDTGIGIPKEMLPQVFDLFMQVAPTLHRTEGGLGIGLTLVRSMVELHGGSVTASSPGPNQGSEFVVRLPLAEVAVRRAESP